MAVQNSKDEGTRQSGVHRKYFLKTLEDLMLMEDNTINFSLSLLEQFVVMLLYDGTSNLATCTEVKKPEEHTTNTSRT